MCVGRQLRSQDHGGTVALPNRVGASSAEGCGVPACVRRRLFPLLVALFSEALAAQRVVAISNRGREPVHRDGRVTDVSPSALRSLRLLRELWGRTLSGPRACEAAAKSAKHLWRSFSRGASIWSRASGSGCRAPAHAAAQGSLRMLCMRMEPPATQSRALCCDSSVARGVDLCACRHQHCCCSAVCHDCYSLRPVARNIGHLIGN